MCYNCDEKWIPGHKCKNAMLFLLDNIDVVHNQEDVEITLYALSGTPTSGTIRVMGRIKQKSFVILIDSSSTHNFIDTTLVS